MGSLIATFVVLPGLSAISLAAIRSGRGPDAPRPKKFVLALGWCLQIMLGFSLVGAFPWRPDLPSPSTTAWLVFGAMAFTWSYGLWLAVRVHDPRGLPTSTRARAVHGVTLVVALAAIGLATSAALLQLFVWLGWLSFGALVVTQVKALQQDAGDTPTTL